MTNRRFFPWFVRALALSALLVALACPMLGFDPCCECPPTALCYCETNPPDCPPPGNNNNGNNSCTDKYGNPIECPSNNNGNGDDNNNNDNELCYDKYGNPIDCPDNNNGGGCDACCGNPQYASAFPDQCSGNNNSPDPPQPPIVGKITIFPVPPDTDNPCSGRIYFDRFGHTVWKIETSNGYSVSAPNTDLQYIVGNVCSFTAAEDIDICHWDAEGTMTIPSNYLNSHPAPVCMEFDLTEAQLISALRKTDLYYQNPPRYNLCSFNCSTCPMEVLKASGHSWPGKNTVKWNGPEKGSLVCPDMDCASSVSPAKLAQNICERNGNSPACPVKGD